MDPDRLASVPLFAELSDRERKQVARWADEVDVSEGTALCRAGSFAHEFFIIEEGTAEVRVDDVPVGELGPGDFFGEIALLETERRTASVVAKTPMRLVVMFGREFRTMDSELPQVAEKVREALRARRERPQEG